MKPRRALSAKPADGPKHGPSETLRRSEQELRLLVDSVKDYAIFLLDPDAIIVSWNAGAMAIKGYLPSEIIGRHVSVFYPPDAIERGWPQQELEIARAEGRLEDEGWRVRKDGTQFWANVVFTALYNPDGSLRGYLKITRDLTERRRVVALEESSRQMNEFLAMLAHELRNPLAPIRNAVSILRSQGPPTPVLQQARDMIDRQVGHLTRLVDDLLDASRVTQGKVVLHKEDLELATIVERAVEAVRPQIARYSHTLDVRVPDEPLRVLADPTRLAQVLSNLLTNAAKYTPNGGQIALDVERDDDHSVIRVRDNGIGIPPEFLERVFDLFTQGDRALDRAEGGLGIGLSVVQRLVLMHGGKVAATSAGRGLGSEFVVRLPLLLGRRSSNARPSERERAPSSSQRNILIVDDNRDAAESLSMVLRHQGHRVRTAYSGLEAVEVAEFFRPDLVLLDIGLPGFDGFEVAARLRRIPALAHTALVALSGYSSDGMRQRSKDAGFRAYLVKPADGETLLRLIADLATAS